ncbi:MULTISPECIES: TraX family protein [Paenibacillus]|uniref:Conjugal transfer protein TraX n=2 Tax=Paenibacillus aceti TaxID=1820010 RepID=A0ABQ1VXV8_9BACL|nr:MULTISPECIES: TraX family protein [Paenibacillus]NWL89266.1 beta-carotene 15,15'-monooxygenase [Paenibacillus sp. 79R4]GGG04324.1 conjugal transfer protein TraX [Paenibacillus aceti]
MQTMRLNGFQIKLIMACLMVLDHIAYFIPGIWVMIFHVVTRVVGVWFAYIAVEGFMYTSNLRKYFTRLFSWAVMMFAGNYVLNLMFEDRGIAIHNNIFLTLAIGVFMLTVLTRINNKIWGFICSVVLLAVGILIAEGGMVILPFMLITYFTYGKNKYRNIGYLCLSLILFLMSFVNYGDVLTTIEMLAFNSDFMFIFVIPFLYIYNGKRGSNSRFAKYFFYVFYPAHLWIITTIAYIVSD